LTISRKISNKFRSKRIIYSETRGMCWHRFLDNKSKEIKWSSRWKVEYNRPIEGRIEWSTRSTDGQKHSILTVGQQVRVICRWQTRGSIDGHEEGSIRRNTQDGKYGGGGSVHYWQIGQGLVFRRS
jgi:hypothetical protein